MAILLKLNQEIKSAFTCQVADLVATQLYGVNFTMEIFWAFLAWLADKRRCTTDYLSQVGEMSRLPTRYYWGASWPTAKLL